jgi:hypothetical protein
LSAGASPEAVEKAEDSATNLPDEKKEFDTIENSEGVV